MTNNQPYLVHVRHFGEPVSVHIIIAVALVVVRLILRVFRGLLRHERADLVANLT
jgi:hypothetical protein